MKRKKNLNFYLCLLYELFYQQTNKDPQKSNYYMKK